MYCTTTDFKFAYYRYTLAMYRDKYKVHVVKQE